jgi:hypothetical protein
MFHFTSKNIVAYYNAGVRLAAGILRDYLCKFFLLKISFLLHHYLVENVELNPIFHNPIN